MFVCKLLSLVALIAAVNGQFGPNTLDSSQFDLNNLGDLGDLVDNTKDMLNKAQGVLQNLPGGSSGPQGGSADLDNALKNVQEQLEAMSGARGETLGQKIFLSGACLAITLMFQQIF